MLPVSTVQAIQVGPALAYIYERRFMHARRTHMAYMPFLCILAIKRLKIYAGIWYARIYCHMSITEYERYGVSVPAISASFSGTAMTKCL